MIGPFFSARVHAPVRCQPANPLDSLAASRDPMLGSRSLLANLLDSLAASRDPILGPRSWAALGRFSSSLCSNVKCLIGSVRIKIVVWRLGHMSSGASSPRSAVELDLENGLLHEQ
jgi:hypothetical protein